MKRFYREATVEPSDGGFAVVLDGRAVNTPAKRRLILPTRALAEAVATEWDAQGEEIRREAMPLTRIACTAIDRVADSRETVIDHIAGYAATDLVCYRAESPPELVERQRAAWGPLLDWVRVHHDTRLRVTTGIVPVPQPTAPVETLRAAAAELDHMMLAALHSVTTACGSLVIALALFDEEIDAETAWAASQIDETFQIERWGEDHELLRRRAELRGEIEAAARFMALGRV